MTYDQFGRGFSDRPNIDYDQELYRRQLLELITELNLKQKFDLIGVSPGGSTVVNFTASYPKMVRKVVLTSPVIKGYKTPIAGELTARFVGVEAIVNRFNDLIDESLN